MKKMWDGRFQKASSQLLETFNASIPFDYRMYRQDIRGSIAHATMLAKQDIISVEESEEMIRGLKQIQTEIENGSLDFSTSDEDIHMGIERRLTEIIGPVAGKLHTARSRNDQVALDFKMYIRDEVFHMRTLIESLQSTIVSIAEREMDTIIPGYTHLQRAQPILLSHHLLAYFEMLQRDKERVSEYLKRLNVLPLGSGALAGTTFPIDRHYVAQLLDFDRVSRNSIDSVSDHDFVIEIASILSMVIMHLSRFSEEIIIWSTSEFGFVKLDDAYATGSSIMPQKKNPDIAELIRGKSGRIYGNLVAILTTMKALPLAYNKDMQEDKEGIFDTLDQMKIILPIFTEMLETLTFNRDAILETMKDGFLNATDVADYLSKKGLPFREAHHVSGSIVSYCEAEDKAIDDLTFEEFTRFSPLFEADILEKITLEACVNERNSYGGTGKSQVRKQLQIAKDLIEEGVAYEV